MAKSKTIITTPKKIITYVQSKRRSLLPAICESYKKTRKSPVSGLTLSVKSKSHKKMLKICRGITTKKSPKKTKSPSKNKPKKASSTPKKTKSPYSSSSGVVTQKHIQSTTDRKYLAMCRKFRTKNLNPLTNRPLSIYSQSYKNLDKHCPTYQQLQHLKKTQNLRKK